MASRTPSRKSSAALDPALAQKKRARRRLIGAAALLLAAVIALPVLLDSEPRQIRGDIEAKIPSRDTPLYERSDPTARSGSIRQVKPQQESAPAASSPAPAVPDSPSQANAAAAAAKSPPAAPAPAPTAKPVDDPIARLARSREAQNPAPTDKATGFIVQVGAYATEKGATEQIERTQKAGYKAYRESVKTAQGERIRVRIGPYASRAQADQVRAKLRTAGIESVLIAP